ncbi:MAG: hypothetical protein EZS28_039771, partial [Streblomastix strix]
MTLDTDQTVTGYKQFVQTIQADKFLKTGGTANLLLLANGGTADVGDFLPKNFPHAMGQMIIEPDSDIRNQGLRLMKNKANWDSFVLTGCNNDPTNTDGVWKMGSTSSQFRIQKQEDQAYDYKGLIIDFDCTSLKFNNQLVSPLPTPPVEQAIKQSLVRSMYESFAWGQVTTYNGRGYISMQVTHSNPNTSSSSTYTLFSIFKDEAKPQFTGSTFTIALNAIITYSFVSLNDLYYRGEVIGSAYYVSLASALAIKLSTYYNLCWLAVSVSSFIYFLLLDNLNQLRSTPQYFDGRYFIRDKKQIKCFEDGKRGLKIVTQAQQNKLMMKAKGHKKQPTKLFESDSESDNSVDAIEEEQPKQVIMALRAIVNVDPVNYGLASSLNIENS